MQRGLIAGRPLCQGVRGTVSPAGLPPGMAIPGAYPSDQRLTLRLHPRSVLEATRAGDDHFVSGTKP